jgi:hypothetical protein
MDNDIKDLSHERQTVIEAIDGHARRVPIHDEL